VAFRAGKSSETGILDEKSRNSPGMCSPTVPSNPAPNELITCLQSVYGVTERGAFEMSSTHQATVRYAIAHPDRAGLRICIKDLGATSFGYGCRPIHVHRWPPLRQAHRSALVHQVHLTAQWAQEYRSVHTGIRYPMPRRSVSATPFGRGRWATLCRLRSRRRLSDPGVSNDTVHGQQCSR
jgi:hypothetical protein